MNWFEINENNTQEEKAAREKLNKVKDFDTLLMIYNGTCSSGYDEFYTKDGLMEILEILQNQEGFDTFEMLANFDGDFSDSAYFYIDVYNTIENVDKEEILDVMEDCVVEMADEMQYYSI